MNRYFICSKSTALQVRYFAKVKSPKVKAEKFREDLRIDEETKPKQKSKAYWKKYWSKKNEFTKPMFRDPNEVTNIKKPPKIKEEIVTTKATVKVKTPTEIEVPIVSKKVSSRKKKISDTITYNSSVLSSPMEVRPTKEGLVVFIDNREQELRKHLGHLEGVYFTNLVVGDIVFEHNNQIAAIIERKTIQDLLQSIGDKRYREQKLRLMTHFPLNKILYLIEGIHDPSSLNKLAFHGSIINILFRDQIRAYRTQSIKETVIFLFRLYAKFNSNEGTGLVTGNGLQEITSDVTEAYVQTVKIQKKLNMTAQVCYRAQIAQIPDIGHRRAAVICKKYPSMLQLCNGYSKLKTLEDRENMLEELPIVSSSGQVKKFGREYSSKVYHYISGKK